MAAHDDAGNPVLPKMRKTRALLAILAMRAAQPVLRTEIIALLWSRRDPFQARASLRQSLLELSDALGPARPLLSADRAHLSISAEGLWLDAEALTRADQAHAQEALALYRPKLLEDLAGIDPAFDRWVEAQRRRLLRAARELAESALAEAADPAAALRAGEQLLAIEPAHETAWRAVIGAHARLGDRSAAADALARCKVALAEHAALTPSAETLAFAEAALVGERPSRRRAQHRPRRASSAPGGYASASCRCGSARRTG